MAADELGGPPGPPDFLIEPPDPPPPPRLRSPAPAGPRDFPAISARGVVEKRIGWLWKPWLPHGFSWLEGDEGTNKSMLAVLLSAVVTRGSPFPGDEEWRPPANVLYLSSGEDPDSVIRDRFVRAEGDLDRLFLLDTQKLFAPETVVKGLPSLPRDTEALFRTAERLEAKLLILDAAFSFLAGEDVFNDQDFRGAIEPFARGVAERGLTALCIRHFTKGTQRVQHQGMGAVAGAAVARAVLTMNRDVPVDKGGTGDPLNVRLLSCSKLSYGPPPIGSKVFRIQSTPGEDPWETAAWLTYEGEVGASAAGAVRQARDSRATVVEDTYTRVKAAVEAALEASTDPIPTVDYQPEEGGSLVQGLKSIAASAGFTGQNFTDSRIGRRLREELGLEAVQIPGKKSLWAWAKKTSNGNHPTSPFSLGHSFTEPPKGGVNESQTGGEEGALVGAPLPPSLVRSHSFTRTNSERETPHPAPVWPPPPQEKK